mmetsp:Transcript_14973/g.37980  ORF Transcript_14973/g.37980 Transcript_14973/m.37980 type:complete len:96 (+) Transcript_14973:41-328(+)
MAPFVCTGIDDSPVHINGFTSRILDKFVDSAPSFSRVLRWHITGYASQETKGNWGVVWRTRFELWFYKSQGIVQSSVAPSPAMVGSGWASRCSRS